jgi:hypothetical protein
MEIEFESLEEELAVIEQMTEDEVCRTYKVDSKEEAFPYVRDWWHFNS